jgi:hypothetical protein
VAREQNTGLVSPTTAPISVSSTAESSSIGLLYQPLTLMGTPHCLQKASELNSGKINSTLQNKFYVHKGATPVVCNTLHTPPVVSAAVPQMQLSMSAKAGISLIKGREEHHLGQMSSGHSDQLAIEDVKIMPDSRVR